VKERPILWSAPMVLALLVGRKTQTRRIVKLPPQPTKRGAWEPMTFGGHGVFDSQRRPVGEHCAIGHSYTGAVVAARFMVGDRLWGRETWAPCEAPIRSGQYQYAADGAVGAMVSDNGGQTWFQRSGHTVGGAPASSCRARHRACCTR
jgi:hypothetical protein